MATFSGKNGKVMWDSSTANEVQVSHIKSWTCKVDVDAVDSSEMGNTFKNRLVGQYNWTATVNCLLDTAGMDIPFPDNDSGSSVELIGENTPAALELWQDTTAGQIQVLYGYGVCNGSAIKLNKDAPAEVTYSFTGNGEIKWASSDPAYT